MSDKYVIILEVTCEAKTKQAAEDMGRKIEHQFAVRVNPDHPVKYAGVHKVIDEVPAKPRKKILRRKPRGDSN